MNLLMVIFALIVVCGVFGVAQSLRERNMLALLFNAGTVLVFGFFTIMTIWKQGFPAGLHH